MLRPGGGPTSAGSRIRGPPSTATARPTSASSAPATPACGPPTSCCAPTRRWPSSSSSARWPASAPRGATAAGCWARSPPARASARRRAKRRSRHSSGAARETVDEVGAACEREGIDCDFVKGGSLTVAQTAPQLARLRERAARRAGWTSTRPARACASPGCGARASRRTARACSRPSSPAAWRRRSSATAGRSTRARPRSTSPRTACGRPRARCAHAGSCAPPRATPLLCPACERALLPLSSSMIVTEPLDADDVGADRLGGLRDPRRRGARLHLRAAHGRRADRHRRARAPLPLRLEHRPRRRDPRRDRPPAARGASRACSRRWPTCASTAPGRGVFGVARDWAAAVHCDRASGLCWAGGYAGEGVAAANLAGPHPARPDPRPRHRRSPACRGSGHQRARLGARAAALAGGADGLRRLPGSGRAGGPDGEAVAARGGGGGSGRALTVIVRVASAARTAASREGVRGVSGEGWAGKYLSWMNIRPTPARRRRPSLDEAVSRGAAPPARAAALSAAGAPAPRAPPAAAPPRGRPFRPARACRATAGRTRAGCGASRARPGR